MSFENVITLVSGGIMIFLILIQVRGAGLGSGLGGSAGSEMNTVRRGSDKTIFQMTIVAAIVFALSILLSLILA